MKLAIRSTLAFLIALCSAPAAIHAQTHIGASSLSDAFLSGVPGGQEDIAGPVNQASFEHKTLSASLATSATHEVQNGSVNSLATIDVRAAVGDLGVKVSGSASAPQSFGTGRLIRSRASGEASWREKILFKTPSGPLFERYTVTFELILDGSVIASSSGMGAANVQFDLVDLGETRTLPPDPYPTFNLWGFASSNSKTNVFLLNDVPAVTIPMTISVLSGLHYTLGYRMEISGAAQADDGVFGTGVAGFEGDVSGSLHWGGIQSVVDSHGMMVPRDQWLFTSESGFDYTRPFGVPEPSSIFLLSIMPCAATFMRRR